MSRERATLLTPAPARLLVGSGKVNWTNRQRIPVQTKILQRNKANIMVLSIQTMYIE
jgi:hypothetical protein